MPAGVMGIYRNQRREDAIEEGRNREVPMEREPKIYLVT
jgi:hypothetical protein